MCNLDPQTCSTSTVCTSLVCDKTNDVLLQNEISTIKDMTLTLGSQLRSRFVSAYFKNAGAH